MSNVFKSEENPGLPPFGWDAIAGHVIPLLWHVPEDHKSHLTRSLMR